MAVNQPLTGTTREGEEFVQISGYRKLEYNYKG